MSTPAGKRSRAVDGGSGVWVPEEITMEIMRRLPTAAALSRFRCVSKSWNRHLSDQFIPQILFSDDEAARRIAVARCSDPESWRRLLSEFVGRALFRDDEAARVMIARSNKGVCGTPNTTSFSIRAIDDALGHVSSGTLPAGSGSETSWASSIAGCSRGIFCIGNSHHKKIILWNPTTSETKVLPSLAPLHRSQVHGRLGGWRGPVAFGFDPIRNDYKVVVRFSTQKGLGLDPDPSGKSEKLFLYSLRENSYRQLHGAPVELFQGGGQKVREYPLAVDASDNYSRSERCHWLLPWRTGQYYYRFTCFDLSKEAFTELQVAVPSPSLRMLPWCDAKDSFHVAKDGSCLVAVYSRAVPWNGWNNNGVSLEVWAELDYAELGRPHECSWIRLYNVESLPTTPRSLHFPGLWKHGKLFAWYRKSHYDGELCVMDLESENENGPVLDPVETKLGSLDYLELVTYLPSTMSLSRFGKRQRCRLIS